KELPDTEIRWGVASNAELRAVREEAVRKLPYAMFRVPPPTQKLEFLAKTLFTAPTEDRDSTSMQAVLATPLYVALAE
ncbi:MAG: hypothetical protein PVI86_19920, partial [Phycisphaerae bacterium]